MFSRDDRAAWRALEPASELAFRTGAGPRAPALARQLFAGCVRRTVFGLDALREKLVCREAGLDDVALELYKARAAGLVVRGALHRVDVELRLVAVTNERLELMCGGERLDCELLAVERAELDAFACGPVRDDPLYARLVAGRSSTSTA